MLKNEDTKLLDWLKNNFPNLVQNVTIDFDQLGTLLTPQHVVEQFGLSWPGKKKVLDSFQNQDNSTYKFIETDCCGDANTQNMFIAADNELALRALQADYASKIKMIYIDPPYNTGNDSFLYADNFKSQATKTENKSENKEEQQHSAWLSMMLIRLKLAYHLLKDDGVVFISIDDAELFNLKLVCDEVFGSDNFIANMVRHCKVGSGHDSKHLAIEYDYILVYAKQKSLVTFNKLSLDVVQTGQYKLSDAHEATRGKYYLRDLDYKGTYSASMDYELTMPDGTPLWSGGKQGEPNTWRWNREKVEWGIANDYIVMKPGKIGWKIYLKQYQYADNKGNPMERVLPYRASIQFLNAQGSQEIKELFGDAMFSFPKSTALIKHLINACCSDLDIVLDFFAGSATTAHAVLDLNISENKNHTFICVQLPELCPPTKSAYKAGYKTIADFSKARIEKAIDALKNKIGTDDVRLGFKCFEVDK